MHVRHVRQGKLQFGSFGRQNFASPVHNRIYLDFHSDRFHLW